jgi:hypothetical protein
VALLGAALTGGGSAYAATLIVTNTADSGAGSLRAAIAAASEGDAIEFDPALNGQTIITSGLGIDKNITINGPGPNQLAVSGSGSQSRVFRITPGHIVIIAGLKISSGSAEGGSGGGIFNEQATLTVNNCQIDGNFAAFGGGIYNNGSLTIIDSIVSNNLAGYTSGLPVGQGGGIFNEETMTIMRSTITGNTAAFSSGGIASFGKLTLTDSTVSNNRAGWDSLSGSGNGGGIQSGGILDIRGSTISENTARGHDSGSCAGVYSSSGVAVITDSTISGNSALAEGGGVCNGETLTITTSTVSGNAAPIGGGIYSGGADGMLEIGNTILKAGASGANIVANGGTITSRGYNLSSDDGGGFLNNSGDQIDNDPLLGPLQDNGGPTFTHAPQTGSLAINAGDPNFTPPPLFDQRGYARVFSGRIDIGSVEVQPTPSPTPTPSATPSATPTPIPAPAQALNISTRLRVDTGDSVMIGGFIVTGTQSKEVALRGLGPSLGGLGITDTLADPTLELRAANGTLLFQNDNWQDDPGQAAQLTALGLAPQHPNESGLVATLQPGGYTAVLAGKNGGTGVGLVEIYDTNQSAASQLANISTRGFVQTGDNVMIGGFILGGSTGSTAIAVRGIGPALTQAGLSNVLADPILELRDSNGALLVSNDNWQDDQVSAAQLSAHGLAPQDPLESGIFASLPPGAFTAILAGKNNGAGLGLIEIYNVP